VAVLFATDRWGSVKPPPTAEVDWAHPLTRGLIRCWLFNEGAGLRIRDLATDDPTTAQTPAAFSWTVGPGGPAIRGDGTINSRFQGTRVPVFANGGATFAARVRVDVLDLAERFITFSTAQPMMLGPHNVDNNRVRFGVTTSGGNATTTSPIGSLVVGEWATWVGTWDSTTLRIYKDGTETSTAASPSGALDPIPSAFYVLGRGVGTDESPECACEWAMAWDRALSAAEVRRLHLGPYAMIRSPWPLRDRLAPLPAQKATPIADIAAGTWTTQAGGTTNLYATIDEDVVDDADYVRCALSPVADDVYEADLATIDDPRTSSGYVATYRAWKDAVGGDAIRLQVDLVENTTVRATWVHADLSTTPTTYQQTLTAVEADNLVDHGNLRLRFSARKV